MRCRKASFSALFLAAFFTASGLGAQSFGFGEADDSEVLLPPASGQSAVRPGARVGGGIDFVASAFFGELEHPAAAVLNSGSVGWLDFEAVGDKAEAAFKLKVSQAVLSEDPARLIDEAYVRLFLGRAMVEGGLLKIVWGKADSQGVLDVLNPFDLSDLSVTDNLERKLARPMLRASFAVGPSLNLEGVFLPSFAPHAVAWEGAWMPAEVGVYKEVLGISSLDDAASVIALPDSSTLEYAQGGARLTTSLASLDLGYQYFYGYLPTFAAAPADVEKYLTEAALSKAAPNLFPEPSPISITYNRYHQVGMDAAAELFGLNWRAEAALNLTEDRSGDDPRVQNPFFGWNLGFDRELFLGIGLNLQGSGSLRLYGKKVSDNGSSDLEHGTKANRTKITAYLSQKLFKETVEWKLGAIWGVEEKDYFFFPSAAYILGDARIDLTFGIFGGDKDGELGQFADSSYAKLSLGYRF